MRMFGHYFSTATRLATILALGVSLHAIPALAKDRPIAAPADVGLSAAQLENLDAKMHSYVDDGKASGVISLVARHGKIAHYDVYGWADREGEKPMEADTEVRMFSMTKPVASVALLMLYEEGKFQLTDLLEDHIPEYADVKVFIGRDENGEAIYEAPKRKITIQDVFRHTAGFSYGDFSDEKLNTRWNAEKIREGSQADFLRNFASYPFIYQPGEKWVYSLSHDVQASLVEHFSGMSFTEFCRQRIFEPLDMPNTYFAQPVERTEKYAVLYTGDENGDAVPVPWDVQPRYGAGAVGGTGMSSTARDYLQFAQMLLNGGELDGKRLLSTKTVEFMTMNHVPDGIQVGGTKGRGYGLGVEVVTDPAQYGLPLSVGQFGWAGAATTYFSVDPEEDMVTIFITQVRPMNLDLYYDFITLSHLAVID